MNTSMTAIRSLPKHGLAAALLAGLLGAACAPDVLPNVQIDPPMATQAIVFGAPATVSFRARLDGQGDVTDSAEWSVEPAALGRFSAPGVLALAGSGGRARIMATWQGNTGNASLLAQLTGEVFLDGLDASAKASFTDRAADPLPANAPAIEYPEDGVVAPANVAPFDIQWSQAADSDLYRVRFTASDTLDVAVYAKQREALVPLPLWQALAATAPDASISITVDGTGPTRLVRTSPPRLMTLTSETVEPTVLYAHTHALNNAGSMTLVDFAKGVESRIASDSPDFQQGACTGCHQVSFDGRRISFLRLGAMPLDMQLGALRYDGASKQFTQVIAPAQSSLASFGAFNPIEGVTRPALLVAVPDAPNTATLALVDPDSNAAVATDLKTMLAAVPASAGTHATMPTWSPRGNLVAFSAYAAASGTNEAPGNGATHGAIIEADVHYDGAAFHFGAPRVVVSPASPAESNLRPAFSLDESAIAFTRHLDSPSPIDSIALVRRSDGQIISIDIGAGTGTGSRSPEWAPSMGPRYAWLAMTSLRRYGHQSTVGTDGTSVLHQMWVCAIDRQKLAAGTADPSLPAFWLSGQTLTKNYLRPKWPQAILP